MNSGKVEKFFRALGWLAIAGIVSSAAVAPSVRSPSWVGYTLLAAGACCLWEWLAGHSRFLLSRTMLGCILAFLLLNCRHDVWFSGFAVSVAAILFGIFSLCFLALAMRRGVGATVPCHWLFCGVVLLIPMIIAVWLAEREYAYAKALVPVIAGQFILFIAAVAVFGGFLAGRRACVFALLLVAARLAILGIA